MTATRRPLLANVVRDELRRDIESGALPPGSKLPNELLLADRFAVSRATVREAVRGLVEEAYLRRVHGSGTYVLSRPPVRNSLDMNFSYTQLIEASGRRAGERCLSLERLEADAELAGRLGIGPGDEVVRLERVRTADDQPVIYSIDVLPGAAVGRDVGDERLQRSLYGLLAELGRPVHHGEAVLTPVAADERTAAVLSCPPGTLLQQIEQVDFDADGEILMISREWHLPPAVELRVFRRGPG